jgi:hypothetical protein
MGQKIVLFQKNVVLEEVEAEEEFGGEQHINNIKMQNNTI